MFMPLAKLVLEPKPKVVGTKCYVEKLVGYTSRIYSIIMYENVDGTKCHKMKLVGVTPWIHTSVNKFTFVLASQTCDHDKVVLWLKVVYNRRWKWNHIICINVWQQLIMCKGIHGINVACYLLDFFSYLCSLRG